MVYIHHKRDLFFPFSACGDEWFLGEGEMPGRGFWVGATSRVVLLAVSGCYIYAMNSGIRNNYGILLNPIIDNSGLSFTSVSLVLAVGQLVFGLVQPLFGIMAAKKGNTPTLLLGVALTIVGMVLKPYCKSVPALLFCLGILLPAGTGAISYGVIMGAIAPKIPARLVSTVSGMVNASSGIGNAVLAPAITALIASGGLAYGMFVLCIPFAVMIPLSLFLGRREAVSSDVSAAGPGSPAPETENAGVTALFRTAFKDGMYLYLTAGFFTCGFHMALITNHLPTEFQSYGFSSEAAAYAFSIYGITTIIGSMVSGGLGGRFRMKNILGSLYGLRPVTILLFFMAPKTLLSISAFTALLGFTGAATVSPVSGLIGRRFGAKNLATLFGVVFVAHQIGGFLGAWLGGICFNATGGYAAIWLIDAALCVFASVVSFAIREAPAGDVAAPPGAA